MRPKSLSLLLLALGCGLVASIGITQMMSQKEAAPALTGDGRSIFVAKTDIGMGDLLSPEMLTLEQWPKDKVPPGAISQMQDIEGRRARARLYVGEPILDNKLLGKGASQQGATALIPKGYRVVPVKVDLVSGGGSLILPGDRVDVMVHLVREISRDIPETVTRTILQDIKVFAVNDVVELQSDSTGQSIAAKTISLLVTPQQAAKVMLASKLGTIQLVMRSPEDDQPSPIVEATPDELFGLASQANRQKESLTPTKQPKSKPSPVVEKKPDDKWTVKIIKPDSVDEVSFDIPPEKGSKKTQ